MIVLSRFVARITEDGSLFFVWEEKTGLIKYYELQGDKGIVLYVISDAGGGISDYLANEH
jgi:hypothetical protein